MGSSRIDPSRNSSTLGPRGCSKAQKSMLNILRIISTVPPPPAAAAAKGTPEKSGFDAKREVKVFGVDLSVVVSAPPQAAAESEADAGNGGDAADCGGGVEVEIEKSSERSELSGEKRKRDEGYNMELLIDAARLIFGDFKEKPEQEPEKNATSESPNSEETVITRVDSPTEPRRLRPRTQCCAVEADGNAAAENSSGEASPVKRSKRGRIQTLPCKYRDSVLEPVTRFTKTRSMTILANRRRSR